MLIERREKARYPLELVVHYQTLGPQSVSGVGRTVNVSSSGALIAAEHDLDEGVRLRVTIEWPTLLDGITPLQLVTTGKVVRHKHFDFCIAFDWYQFRTMKRRQSPLLSRTMIKAAAALSATPALAQSGSAKTAERIPLRNAG